jgi:uncharacterized protein (TIGR02001 family)
MHCRTTVYTRKSLYFNEKQKWHGGCCKLGEANLNNIFKGELNMKTYLALAVSCFLVAGLAAPGMAMAQETGEKYDHAGKHQPFGMEITGDIGVFSQYVWRGVAQNSGHPAVQGDLGVGLGGLSASVWFSNDYPSPDPQFGGRDVVEFDWRIDYSGNIGDFRYSIGGIYYSYLYDAASNFPEIYAGLSYDALLSPTATIYYTASDSTNSTYLAGDIWIDLGFSHSLEDLGVDLSGTLSFVNWSTDPARTPDFFQDGISLIALGISKDIEASDVTITPSFGVSIPVVSDSADGNKYIYGAQAENEVAFGVNVAF